MATQVHETSAGGGNIIITTRRESTLSISGGIARFTMPEDSDYH